MRRLLPALLLTFLAAPTAAQPLVQVSGRTRTALEADLGGLLLAPALVLAALGLAALVGVFLWRARPAARSVWLLQLAVESAERDALAERLRAAGPGGALEALRSTRARWRFVRLRATGPIAPDAAEWELARLERIAARRPPPGGGLALLHLVASVDSGRGALVTEDPSTVERLLAEGRAATLRTRWSLPVARPHHGTATAC
ncbi:MAG TPA: hypothetical protein RMH85_20920 [Polyangiaceae bacterium LLY-WYZ-15_(1-7)]|nr:hypothetical protein [Polyangiaceae bacterium LLY-WYZ-15_(1-7)]